MAKEQPKQPAPQPLKFEPPQIAPAGIFAVNVSRNPFDVEFWHIKKNGVNASLHFGPGETIKINAQMRDAAEMQGLIKQGVILIQEN